jgi:hypothetical protein
MGDWCRRTTTGESCWIPATYAPCSTVPRGCVGNLILAEVPCFQSPPHRSLTLIWVWLAGRGARGSMCSDEAEGAPSRQQAVQIVSPAGSKIEIGGVLDVFLGGEESLADQESGWSQSPINSEAVLPAGRRDSIGLNYCAAVPCLALQCPSQISATRGFVETPRS